MSPVERRRGALARQVGSELRLVFGRRRNQVLLAGIGLVPLLIGVALKINGPGQGGDGPQFLSQVTENGLFLVFTSLVITLPFLLPLVVAIVSGDTIAGEANAGTLRYLLTVPVGRPRLLLAKFAGSAVYAAAAVLTVGAVGLVAGGALFGFGRVTLLSGDAVGLGDGLLRAAVITGYVTLSLLGLVAVGLFLSTLTEVPVAAMAATIAFAVVSAVIDAIPQLRVIHPYLLTHHWLDFGEVLRQHPQVGLLLRGLAVQAGYVAVACSLAYSRFVNADVTA